METISKNDAIRLLAAWAAIVCGQQKYVTRGKRFGRSVLISEMDRLLTPVLDATLLSLGVGLDEKIIEQIVKSAGSKEKARFQRVLIGNLMRQLKAFPMDGDAFLPADIRKARAFNCAGGVLLLGRLLQLAGIENYYGLAYRHAVNFARLSDGSLYYLCTRASLGQRVRGRKGTLGSLQDNMIRISGRNSSAFGGSIDYLSIHSRRTPYEVVLLIPKGEAVFFMIDNMEDELFSEVSRLLFPNPYRFIGTSPLWARETRRFNSDSGKNKLRRLFVG